MSTSFDPDELRELEQRLTERLESIAPRPRPVAGDRVRAAIATTPQRHGPLAWLRARTPEPAWSRLLAVSATALVALAIGIGIGRSVLTTASHSPSSIPSVTGNSTSSPGPSAEPPTDIYQSWQRADLPQGTSQAHGNPHDVVEFKGSLVVVGGAETQKCLGAPCVPETGAAVWGRVDGEWQRLPQQPSFDAGSMTSMAATRSRLLVLGETATSPRGTGEGLLWPELWVSDDGMTFRAYDAPAQFRAIVAADSGYALFLAASTTTDGTGTEIWRSLDGLTWEQVTDRDPPTETHKLGGAQITVLRRIGLSTFLALGVMSGKDDAVANAVVWTSEGGQLWSQIAEPALGEIEDVGGAEGHIVAVGHAGGERGMAWISNETDTAWTQAHQPPIPDYPLGGVLEVPGGFIAYRDPREGGPTLWVSNTGDRWDAVPTQESLGPDDFLGPMTLTAGGDLIATGVHDPGGSRTASVWTSASPFPTPAPSLPTTTEYGSWKSMSMPDPTPHALVGEWPSAAVDFNGQLIAVGGTYGSCCTGAFSTDTRAIVWRRSGPIAWQLEPNEAVFAFGHMSDIATDGHLLVAVGDVQSKTSPSDRADVGAVWMSSDGTSWHRTTGMPFFYGVTWFRGRFYGLSQAPPESASSVWSSSDGRSWSLVKRIDGDFLQALRATPFGLVAVGSGSVTPSKGPAIWFSSDGASWTRSTVPGGDQEVVTDVAGSASTLMAIGLGDTGGPAVWISHDGVSWSQTVDDFMFSDPTGPQLERVTWGGDSFVALGEGDVGGSTIGFRAMTSTDGVHWELVPPNDRLSSSTGRITALVRLSTGELAVLARGDENVAYHETPMAWLAQP